VWEKIKMKDITIQFLKKYKMPSIVSGFLIFLGGLVIRYHNLVTQLYSNLKLTEKAQALVIAILLLVIIGLIAWCIVLVKSLNKQPNLYSRFGIYWDKEGNSYCPSCRKMTSNVEWKTYINQQAKALYCPSCDNRYVLTDKNGEIVHFPDAKRIVNN